jgi:pimeloyl-ACP methyl ester carboxylesterase
MTVAASQPGRLASAVFNDISPEPCPAGLARIASVFAGGQRPLPSVEAFWEQILGVYAPRIKSLPREAAIAIARWFVREADGGWQPKFDARALQRLVELDNVPQHSQTLWQGFRKLDCPVLLLRAEHSDILSPEAARAMQTTRPLANFAEIRGAWHPPALIEPDAQTALKKFLGA